MFYSKNQFSPFLFCFTSSLSQALTFLRPNSSKPSLTFADLLATLHSPIFSPFATLHSPADLPFVMLHSSAVRDDSVRRRFSLSHCRRFSLSHHSQRFTRRPFVTVQSVANSHSLTIRNASLAGRSTVRDASFAYRSTVRDASLAGRS